MIGSIDFQIKGLSYSNWIIMAMLTVQMFVSKTPQYYCYTFDDVSLYFTIVSQVYFFLYFAPTVFAQRYLYGIIFTELTVQYKLLNSSFSKMKTMDDLKNLVEHNCLLNRVAFEMNETFSIFLVVCYITTVLPATSQIIMGLSADSYVI